MNEKMLTRELNYTCEGSFNNAGEFMLQTRLPNKDYHVKAFDVSVNDAGSVINAILVLITSPKTDEEFEWQDNDPLHNFNTITFNHTVFSPSNSTSLVLIYHSKGLDLTPGDTESEKILEIFKGKVKDWYDIAEREGAQSIRFDYDKTIPERLKIPKKLGMSIVVKPTV